MLRLVHPAIGYDIYHSVLFLSRLTDPQLNNFAVAFFVPPMLENWAWGTYIFFAVFLAGGIVWVHFQLPETKGEFTFLIQYFQV